MLLNDLQVKEEIGKYFKMKNNENKTSNVWDAAEAVLRRKFMTSNEHSRKKEWWKINTLSFHIMKLDEEQMKLK